MDIGLGWGGTIAAFDVVDQGAQGAGGRLVSSGEESVTGILEILEAMSKVKVIACFGERPECQVEELHVLALVLSGGALHDIGGDRHR